MDHAALVKSLPAQTKAELTARSNRAGLRHLALYGLSMGFCTTGIILQIPLWPLLMLPQGILLIFLFTLSHECTHQTPFRSPWINDWAGHACAVLIALPFVWFRYFHLAHHKYTNDPERDPELEHGPRPSDWRSLLIYLSGLGYWRSMMRIILANAQGDFPASYLPVRRHASMQREAKIILVIYAVVGLTLLVSPMLLWLWLVPLLVGQPFLRAYLLAEHGLCPPVANMLETSRTTFTNRLVRFLAWNMPYHAEHHSYPNVPFHQLPAFHGFTQAHLKSTSDSYAEFTADYVEQIEK